MTSGANARCTVRLAEWGTVLLVQIITKHHSLLLLVVDSTALYLSGV